MAWYARGDIDAHFATTYRLPTPKGAQFAIGWQTTQISMSLHLLKTHPQRAKYRLPQFVPGFVPTKTPLV
jgi:hypothetical protein